MRSEYPSPKFQIKVGCNVTPTVIPKIVEIFVNVASLSLQKYMGIPTRAFDFGAMKSPRCGSNWVMRSDNEIAEAVTLGLGLYVRFGRGFAVTGIGFGDFLIVERGLGVEDTFGFGVDPGLFCSAVMTICPLLGSA